MINTDTFVFEGTVYYRDREGNLLPKQTRVTIEARDRQQACDIIRRYGMEALECVGTVDETENSD